MSNANDIVGYLAQRGRRSLRPGPLEPSASWSQWLGRPVAAHDGADAAGLLGVVAAREPRRPPRAPLELGRWDAFRRMFWQGWEPSDADQRGLRWGSRIADVLLHVVLVALLLWLMYLRFMIPTAPAETDDAVQVEFIGEGNREEGGGAPSQQAAQAASAASSAAAASASAAASSASAAPPAPVTGEAASPLPPPDPLATPDPVLPSAQPLQVTEVPMPDPESFQAPPPRERSVQTPSVELRVPQREVAVEEVPVLQPQQVRRLQPRAPEQQVRVPGLNQQVREMEAPRSMPQVAARPAPNATPSTAQVRVPGTRAGIAEIPMPSSGTAAASGNVPAAGSAASGTTSSPGNAPSAATGGRGIAQAGAGAGPARTPAPGGWPGAARNDDWGASSRNRPGSGSGSGQRQGLVGDDGRVRLPDQWSDQSVVDFDRAGQWLKRPGLEYRGTRFDEIWIPGGTLLEEWVRRGIRQVRIPIPGSKRHLECVVSVLQLGGGCYPVNPDANEQPARARKPPDIPFKPELQEDNGSVRPG